MKADPGSTALTLLLGAFMSILPLALDSTLPALPAIQQAFAASSAEVQLAVTAYIFGITGGQLLYGPLSDRYGRRPVLLGALAVYAGAAALSSVAASLAFLVGLRFLQGFAAACGPVLARTIVRDLASNEAAARLMSRVMLVFAVATIVGPLMGGVLVSLGGWPSIFWTLAAVGLALFAAAYWRLPETAPPDRQGLGPAQLARNFAHLLSRRSFLAPTVVALVSQIGVFAFVTNSALVVVPVLGYTPGEYGLLFGLIMIGHIIGVQIGNRRVLRDGIPRMLHAGAVVSCIGGVLIAWLSWRGVSGGAAFAIPMGLFMIGNGLIMPNASAAALSPFPRIAGCAASLQAMLYLMGGAATGLAVSALFDGTSRPLCTVIGLSGIAVLLVERAFSGGRAGSARELDAHARASIHLP